MLYQCVVLTDETIRTIADLTVCPDDVPLFVRKIKKDYPGWRHTQIELAVINAIENLTIKQAENLLRSDIAEILKSRYLSPEDLDDLLKKHPNFTKEKIKETCKSMFKTEVYNNMEEIVQQRAERYRVREDVGTLIELWREIFQRASGIKDK